MRIMIGTSKIIDVRAALINYVTLENGIENKKNRKYYITIMLIEGRVIYTLYYKEDQLVRNNVINYEFDKILSLYLILDEHSLSF